ncbi:HpcH/HpaI aldolase/citrate lyase family protein [Gordonia rhizosphera]|uniref:Putative citrate lyase beta chain n=1 Tax=Gordonia rhizosphera NBRC 16068 TaxID=1108045 RepID=K6WEA4_9ACTN|nr:CoA ester lyase [Gordonia rhizosphera]GAB92081.1 putative citrate lyase beta chain [Gordonia rhizosphera NBRC 16068]
MSSARSYLFVPGHRHQMADKAFTRGADEVIIDLEDAVPAADKQTARTNAREILGRRRGWVRINAVGSADAVADLNAVAGHAYGVRIPKVDSPRDVAWVASRLPKGTKLLCAIETARGVLAAPEIASLPGVERLALGGIDLRADLRCGTSPHALDYARSALVIASRAHGLASPIDSVFAHVNDPAALAEEARIARELGFGAKSAIHPKQLDTIHRVFMPSANDITWATTIMHALEISDGRPTTTSDGEFIDAPVEARARRILAHHDDRSAATG